MMSRDKHGQHKNKQDAVNKMYQLEKNRICLKYGIFVKGNMLRERYVS
jgi:hypothetical protein